MLLKQLFDQNTCTYTYLLADLDAQEAIIIDPVVEQIERDLKLVTELELDLIYTLDTHVHADHITGSGQLRKRTGALSGVSHTAQIECVDRHLYHGDLLRFGQYNLEVRNTPGHTSACLSFVVLTELQKYVFTGDALFIRGCGRTDFQEGDASTLFNSVHHQIYSLPNDTIIYPGHDYRGHTSTTVGEEKNHNPRLNTTMNESSFVHLMNRLELEHPKRIHEALPANLACGMVKEKPSEEDSSETSAINEDKLAGRVVIDVRSVEEFLGDVARLPDAVSAPLPELRQRALAWTRDLPILLVCRSGKRSSEGRAILVEMGFSDVRDLTGGLLAWSGQKESML